MINGPRADNVCTLTEDERERLKKVWDGLFGVIIWFAGGRIKNVCLSGRLLILVEENTWKTAWDFYTFAHRLGENEKILSISSMFLFVLNFKI